MCNFTERDLDLQAIHDDAATFAQSYFQKTNAWSKMLYFTHQKFVLVSGFLDLNRLFRCCYAVRMVGYQPVWETITSASTRSRYTTR
jgi:hypothetical protein